MTRDKWSEKCNVPGSKDRESGVLAKEHGQPLEAGKKTRKHYPLEPLERNATL